MPGKCYKCSHELSDPTVQFCPWCGAKFAARDSHYMADGRTITSTDENAYLSSPPPKAKRSPAKFLIIGIIGAVAVLLLLAAIGAASTEKADATYDYEFMGVFTDGDTGEPVAEFNFAIRNDKPDPMDLSRITVTLTINGKASQSKALDAVWLYEGQTYQWPQLFHIDESDKQYAMGLTISSDEYKLTRGTVVFWRNPLNRWGQPTIPYQSTTRLVLHGHNPFYPRGLASMKEATTPTILLRTKKDMRDCTEIRVALTKRGATTPTVVKSLSTSTLTVPGAGVMFSLTQKESTDLGGFAVIDMRAKYQDGTVVGFRQKPIHINRSYDTVVI